MMCGNHCLTVSLTSTGWIETIIGKVPCLSNWNWFAQYHVGPAAFLDIPKNYLWIISHLWFFSVQFRSASETTSLSLNGPIDTTEGSVKKFVIEKATVCSGSFMQNDVSSPSWWRFHCWIVHAYNFSTVLLLLSLRCFTVNIVQSSPILIEWQRRIGE